MGFKENLKAELFYKGMTVQELAELTGISKHTLDNYLNTREQSPSAQNAVKIASALGVTVEHLVLGARGQAVLPRKVTSSELHDLMQIVESFDKNTQDCMLSLAKSIKKLVKNNPS